MFSTHRIAAIALLVAASSACVADAPAAEISSRDVHPAEAHALPALTDANIAHIAVTANSIDIDIARLVESRTRTPDIRAFANTMITDHTAVIAQASALVTRLGVTPAEHEVSRSLSSGAVTARAELEKLRGAEFDRAYIAREVAYHAAVLDALDQTLIPGASNAELKSLLESVRPAIATHLAHARSLQSSLVTPQ